MNEVKTHSNVRHAPTATSIVRLGSRMRVLTLVIAAVAAMAVPSALHAQNIVAQSVSVEQEGSATIAKLNYSVGLIAVGGPYDLAFVLDKGGDGAVDPGDLVLTTVNVASTTLGVYADGVDIRPLLDALPGADRVADGDRILGIVNYLDVQTEFFYTDNIVASDPLYVDIIAKTLTLDAANMATFTYLIDSPGKVHNFDIEYYLDDNPQNGVLDATDTLVFTDSVGGNPGVKKQMADFSANVPAPGQVIFAVADPADEVDENKQNNNDAATANVAQTDLVANQLSYDEISQDATLSYTVNSPTDVAAYNIFFYLDRNNSGVLDAGDGPRVGVVAGDVTLGNHTAVQNFLGDVPVSGQFVFAWVDRNDTVTESDETNDSNRAAAQNTDILDLEAVVLSYDSTAKEATLSYLVNGPTVVLPYSIRFVLDRNNDGIATGADAPPVAVVLGDVNPGAHVFVQSFAGADAPASYQKVFAMVDAFDDVTPEDDELNNDAETANTTPTDLVAVSIAYDNTLQEATLTYTVNAPIDVPPYTIEFAIDTNNSGVPDAGDTNIAVAGDVTPGPHTLTQSYAVEPAASGQFVFAWIDRLDSVDELDDVVNNQVTTANSATTDLEAIALTYDPTMQTATLSYAVNSPVAVLDNTIQFYLDSNNSLTLDGGDVLVDTVVGSITPGSGIAIGDFSGAPAASGQMVFATIESAAVVAESDETNNEAAGANTAPTDLVANLVGSLVYDANLKLVVLNYEVVSPIDVVPYDITFVLDSDNNFVPSPGDDIVTTVPGNVTPGLHTEIQSYAAFPADSFQFIFAILDYPPGLGGNVAEDNELNNVAFGVNTEETDLEVVSMSYDSNLKTATLSYVVMAPIDVTSNAIQFYIDDNPQNGVFDVTDSFVYAVAGDVSPGAHTATGLYLANPPASNQKIFATIDTGNAVIETDEANNVGEALNWTQTDLIAISLAYDSNTEKAVLSYTVDAPINVPLYNIEFALDTDNSGGPTPGDTIVAAIPGQVIPGSYATAPVSFAGNVPATGQLIFAQIDRLPGPNGNVTETIEIANNFVSTSNSQGTDLVANSVQIIVDNFNNETRARVAYTINSPVPADPFSLKVGLDRDANGVIDGGGSDVLADMLVNNPVDLAPGAHTMDVPNFRSALNSLPLLSRIQQGAQIVATLDLNQDGSAAGAVTETEEIVNNRTATMPTVDLVANSIAVTTDPSAGWTKAYVSFSVDSPGAVEEFDIRVGLDRNNDGVIDDPADVLIVTHVDGNKLKPGLRGITTDDFRLALNAASPAIKQNDRIIAIIDLNQNNTPVNDVTELDEFDNNVTKQKQKIDLVANSISVNTDVLLGTTEADVTYTVVSPGSVAEFVLRVGVDRDGDGNIDDPDGLLLPQPLTGADLEPGSHTITVGGLRAALNALTTPLKNGDAIVATLDLLLDGTDEAFVAEDIETDNNKTSQIQTVDLVANSIAIQSDDIAGKTTVSVSYLVNSPADVAQFDILIGVDRDGDDIIDADITDLLVPMVAPGLTPGTHTADIADIRPALEALTTRLANGDSIIATLDLDQAGAPIDSVIEAEQITNNRTSQAQSVDLVSTEIALFTTPGSGQKKARVNYTVSSPGTVSTFTIRVGIDADNNGVLDPGSVLRIYDVEPDLGVAELQPGDHSITTDDLTADLNLLEIQNGQRIIATLDLADVDPFDPGVENNVVESEDVANNKSRLPLDVDLIAISLAYDSNTDIATLSYWVNSVGGVPAYDIEFYLDDGPTIGVLDANDTLIDTVAGDQLPGEHTVAGNYTTTQVNTSQFIFAVLDTGSTVGELDETNNEAATDNTEITDLVANTITIVSDDSTNQTNATVAYTIVAPDPFAVPAFDILIGVDRDGDNMIDSLADVLDAIAAPVLTPGSHNVTSANLRGALEALVDRLDNGDSIIAMLDLTFDGIAVNNVDEIGGDETGNNVASQGMQVDLVATAVEVLTLPGSGDLIARINYTVNSPAAVDTFHIRVGVDSDGDKILDPGSLLADIDLAAEAASKVRPGDRVVDTLDLTAALNALPVPLENTDRIIATLDLVDDGFGTPEDLVVESEEMDNNFARSPQTVDLVAQSIFLTVDNAAGTTGVTVAYTVNSIAMTADFELRIGIDRDGDDIIDGGAGDLILQSTLTGVDAEPGAHVFEDLAIRPALNALVPPIEYGDRIIATLDLALAGTDEAAVKELTEVGNNVTSTAGTQDQIIDISADELNLTVGSFIAVLNYTVTSPSNVAPFRIHIGRDTDADDVIDDLLVDVAGDPTPGAHQVSEDVAAQLLALGVLAGETVDIVAQVDVLNEVVEVEEGNNKLTGSADYLVDLVVGRLTHPCAILDNVFDVEVDYSVMLNQPFDDFTICVYASDDDDAAINLPDDILLGCINVTAAADKTVGDHMLVIAGVNVSSNDFPTENFFVKVRLDGALAVNEVDEGNNVLARPNAAQDPSEDADGDGVPDCFDECPADVAKTSPGACGCGVADTDTDGDGVPDCLDNCPDDADKLDPGVCGCGNVDDLTDTDLDGVPDCADVDPNDPNVPNPLPETPGGQDLPGADENLFEIILPIFPLVPLPVCGIGICGSGAMVPLGVMVLGFVGLKARSRRRRRIGRRGA